MPQLEKYQIAAFARTPRYGTDNNDHHSSTYFQRALFQTYRRCNICSILWFGWAQFKRVMLGSSEAPALPPFQTLQPQVAQQIAEHIGAGTQEPVDTDPTLQHAVDKDTDRDSSGLVQTTA